DLEGRQAGGRLPGWRHGRLDRIRSGCLRHGIGPLLMVRLQSIVGTDAMTTGVKTIISVRRGFAAAITQREVSDGLRAVGRTARVPAGGARVRCPRARAIRSRMG